MARIRSTFVCQSCGNQSPKWLGRCPGCGAWESLVEERSTPERHTSASFSGLREAAKAVPLRDVAMSAGTRWKLGMSELDRVLGGGLVPGAMILVSGDPGVGKSTLLTQVGRYIGTKTLLYVTGEESPRQVRLRAERLGVDSDRVHLLHATQMEEIAEAVRTVAPDIIIVDSIQTLHRADVESAPGSVSQVRECASALQQIAKGQERVVFIIGHVTKQGVVAGPRVLEHLVDTVLYLEGDRFHEYRVLRAVKNRFGSTHEMGVFEMRADGLHEVGNPSALFLRERQASASGAVVACSMEGTRPILVEVQALVTPTSYATPQRTATGVDGKRMQMILAVIEKRIGIRLSGMDVFVNIAGGLRLDDPSLDLAVAAAIVSSVKDHAVDEGTTIMGEVGLGGEIRSISNLEQRLKEVGKLGFQKAMVPARHVDEMLPPSALKIVPISTLAEAFKTMGWK